MRVRLYLSFHTIKSKTSFQCIFTKRGKFKFNSANPICSFNLWLFKKEKKKTTEQRVHFMWRAQFSLMHPSRWEEKHHKWQNTSPPSTRQTTSTGVFLSASEQSRVSPANHVVNPMVFALPPIPAFALLLITAISPQTQFALKLTCYFGRSPGVERQESET